MSQEPTQPPPPEPLPPIPPPADPGAASSVSQDDRTMAMLCHLGGILGILVPLIIWLIKKDQSRFVNDQGKEALNFQLTMLIGFIIGGVTVCFTFGLIIVAVWVINLVFCILAAVAASRGEAYRYPFKITLIR